MAKKIHMYTKEKGVSCGKRVQVQGNIVRNVINSNIRTTYDPSVVTCKSCLKKIVSEKAWVSKKGIFTSGYTLRIVKNTNGKWEVVLYMNGYKVGNIRKRDGGKEYTTKSRAFFAAQSFKSGIRRNYNTLAIVVD